jgi:hypothetical protein
VGVGSSSNNRVMRDRARVLSMKMARPKIDRYTEKKKRRRKGWWRWFPWLDERVDQKIKRDHNIKEPMQK